MMLQTLPVAYVIPFSASSLEIETHFHLGAAMAQLQILTSSDILFCDFLKSYCFPGKEPFGAFCHFFLSEIQLDAWGCTIPLAALGMKGPHRAAA